MTQVQATKITTTIETKIEQLKNGLSGQVILPSDDAYESARRIWNAMIDKRPALIARCATTSDVVRAVNFARDNGRPPRRARRRAQHRRQRLVRRRPRDRPVADEGRDASTLRARRVTVEAGATLADLDAATQAHGLATPLGINSTTGVAGLTLGGGFGWLSRKYGMTIDNLESAEVVTADGKVVRASATENPDLFWALRGGGGNFGVVTRSSSGSTRSAPTVLSGLIVYPFAEAKAVLQQYRDFVAKAPDELTVWAVLRKAPPLPFLPDGGARQGGRRARAALRGRSEAGRAAHRAAAAVRHAARRARRRPAVRRLAAGVRPAAHAGRAQLLEVAQLHDARGRALRRRHRVHREAAVAAVRDLHRRPRRRHHAAGARTPRPTPTATRSSS